MPVLAWRNTSAGDRSVLQSFECTTRSRHGIRTVYPRPWERSIEVAVRGVNPRQGGAAHLRVGLDAHGIAAVACAAYAPAYNAYMVEMIAIASRCRGAGGIYADEAIEEATQIALGMQDAADVEVPFVMADVDPRNRAAGFLLRRNGYRLDSQDHDRQVWFFEPGALPFT